MESGSNLIRTKGKFNDKNRNLRSDEAKYRRTSARGFVIGPHSFKNSADIFMVHYVTVSKLLVSRLTSGIVTSRAERNGCILTRQHNDLGAGAYCALHVPARKMIEQSPTKMRLPSRST